MAENMLYSKTHEWVKVEPGAGGKVATMGLTSFALEQLTDLVHVELPPPGRKVTAGQPLGEIESVKAVSDLYSPVDGEVAEVNSAIAGNLQNLPQDPYKAGWLVKIKVGNEAGLAALMNEAAYKKQCEEEQH